MENLGGSVGLGGPGDSRSPHSLLAATSLGEDKVTLQPFEGKNYEDWFVVARVLLMTVKPNKQLACLIAALQGDALTVAASYLRSAGEQPTVTGMFTALQTHFGNLQDPHSLRQRLRALVQTGSLENYISEFSSRLLQIRDMSEQDKIDHFLTGMHPQAALELRRQFGPHPIGTWYYASFEQAARRIAATMPSICTPVSQAPIGNVTATSPDPSLTQMVVEGVLAAINHRGGYQGERRNKGKGCWDCQEPGHRRGDPRCQKPRCPHCKGYGHDANICPNKASSGYMGLNTEVTKLRLGKGVFYQMDNTRSDLIVLKVRINGHEARALIDSGASYTFITESFAKKADLTLRPTRPRAVYFGNGEYQKINNAVNVDMEVDSGPKVPLHACVFNAGPIMFDIVLGMTWLRRWKAPVLTSKMMPLYLEDTL